jgi:hypothetical protein
MVPFIIIITPYMMISYNVFKSPMTNENSTLLWLDSFDQGYTIKNSEDIPDFRSYIESHDAGDILGRLLKGMGFQISVLFLSTATVSFFTRFSPFITPLTGLAIGVMFLYGYTKCRNRELKIYTIFMIIIFLVLLGWITDVISGQRYQLPLLTLILPFSAHGMVILTEKLKNRIRIFHRIRMKHFLGIPIIIIMFISGFGIIRSTPRAEMTLNRPTNAFNLLSKWAEDHIEKGQVYYGPMFEYHFQLFSEKIREKSFTYPIPIAKAFKNDVRKGRYTLPLAKDIGELNEFLKDYPASYIILSAFEILYPPDNFLAEYFRWHIDADNKFVSEKNKLLRHFYFMNDYYASVKAYLGVHLEQVKDIPGLELAYQDPNPPVDFFVFKVK